MRTTLTNLLKARCNIHPQAPYKPSSGLIGRAMERRLSEPVLESLRGIVEVFDVVGNHRGVASIGLSSEQEVGITTRSSFAHDSRPQSGGFLPIASRDLDPRERRGESVERREAALHPAM